MVERKRALGILEAGVQIMGAFLTSVATTGEGREKLQGACESKGIQSISRGLEMTHGRKPCHACMRAFALIGR